MMDPPFSRWRARCKKKNPWQPLSPRRIIWAGALIDEANLNFELDPGCKWAPKTRRTDLSPVQLQLIGVLSYKLRAIRTGQPFLARPLARGQFFLHKRAGLTDLELRVNLLGQNRWSPMKSLRECGVFAGYGSLVIILLTRWVIRPTAKPSGVICSGERGGVPED